MSDTTVPSSLVSDIEVDLFVIGGGINGAAVARDAAGRGLRVMLSEKRDYGSETSSASSKLIHGGLRYLEHFEFGLVRESLREREIMMATAPHLVRPLRFLVPVYRNANRPAWFLRMGLMLYDLMARSRKLERSGALDAAERENVPHLRKEGLTSVLHYSDCQVDDARLVLSVLLDARRKGAQIANYQEVVALEPTANGYQVRIRDAVGERIVAARFVVNTTGPFSNQILDICSKDLPRKKQRLVRGSHILLPMPAPPIDTAFTLQNDDGRVVFVIPWMLGPYLMVGTTDATHVGDPHGAVCSDVERDYLLDVFNNHFSSGNGFLKPKHIVWSWAGVRPLVDDGAKDPSKVTREVEIVHTNQGNGGFITVYGGKLTTHRSLAEKVMTRLSRMGCRTRASWTANAPLYGGGLSRLDLEKLPGTGPELLSEAVRSRLVMTYGDVARDIFETIHVEPALAAEIAPGVPVAELEHARNVEDTRNAEDFLSRRTKLFLVLDENGRSSIKQWFGE